jgi:hypothetical protein
MRLLNERTMFKILVDKDGAMFSITTKKRAYFFFLSGEFVGAKVAPTTDPYPGIVEVCGYNIPKILRTWDVLYRIKLTDS